MKVALYTIDPQNDFCVADSGAEIKAALMKQGMAQVQAEAMVDPYSHKGTLVVPGAHDDMKRAAAMIRRIGSKLDEIIVTLDSHQGVGIERPHWWRRISDGSMPAPFTILGIHPDGKRIVKFTVDASGFHPTDEEYRTYKPSFMHKGGPTGKGVFGYLEALAAKGRYPHVVWTVHCVVGTWGWSVVKELADALLWWEQSEFGRVNYITKGNNPWTEHFSAVQAEVPDPSDPSTQVNTKLVSTLEEADIIVVDGEALSHCISSTFRDTVANFANPEYIKKMVLLRDCMSNVPGFELQGDTFLKEVLAKGAQMSTSVEFLA